MDRQDIDALLVGALYGELTPADEARLAAHLEAHPADRGALDDLKSARAKVRESRIFEDAGSSGGVIEPPQHISALLLQEAHRRAPKRAVATEGEQRDSWFFRVTRMFLAHPAMAAAAMLVLVIGVAGTLYSKKGASFGERTAPSMQSENTAGPSGADQPVAQGSAAYAAQLADPSDLAEGTAAERWDNEAEKKEDAPAIVANAKPKAEPSRRRAEGIEVSTEQQQPKEYLGAKDSGKLAAAPAKAVAKGSVAKNDAYRDSDGVADDRARHHDDDRVRLRPRHGRRRSVRWWWCSQHGRRTTVASAASTGGQLRCCAEAGRRERQEDLDGREGARPDDNDADRARSDGNAARFDTHQLGEVDALASDREGQSR
jgi:hypothetical protein